jgi:hypothetical protein
MRTSLCFSKALRRTLAALLPLLVAAPALAQWMPLGRNEDFRIYLDPKLIRSNGDLTQIWQLMDFTAAQWTDAQTVVGSIKTLIEYDCAAMRSRTLAGEAYSEQMGDGRKVASEHRPDAQWESVEPGTTSDKVRQIACAKK